MKKTALLLLFALTLGMLFSCNSTGTKGIGEIISQADAFLEKGPYEVKTFVSRKGRTDSWSEGSGHPLKDAIVTVDGDKLSITANIYKTADTFFETNAVIIDGVCYAQYLDKKVKMNLTAASIKEIDVSRLDMSALVSDFSGVEVKKLSNKTTVYLTGAKDKISEDGLGVFGYTSYVHYIDASGEIEIENARYKSVKISYTYDFITIPVDVVYKFVFSYNDVKSVEMPADISEYEYRQD